MLSNLWMGVEELGESRDVCLQGIRFQLGCQELLQCSASAACLCRSDKLRAFADCESAIPALG